MANLVNSFALSRLSNAYHAAFAHAVTTQIEAIGDENLGLPAGFNRKFINAVKAENDLVNHTTGSAISDQMADKDKERTNLFRAVRNVLKNTKYTSNAETAQLYDVIYKKILKIYPSAISKENGHVKSSHIRGFIFDCKQFLTESQRNSLGITTDLTALDTANEAYEVLYLSRVDEYVQNPVGYTAECRAKVDGLWDQVVRTLNYYANEMSNPSEDIQAVSLNAIAYVENLNKHISEFLRSVNASASHKKSVADETESEASADSANEEKGSGNEGNSADTGADGDTELNKKPLVSGGSVVDDSAA